MLAAVQPAQQLLEHACGRPREAGEHIRPDRCVPALDDRLVHCDDRWEGPLVQAQRTAVSEMRVAGKKDRHIARLTQLAARTEETKCRNSMLLRHSPAETAPRASWLRSSNESAATR